MNSVVKLRPPIWISSRITTLPKRLQLVAVVTVTSPVTQTADVETKNASSGSTRTPGAWEIGRLRISPPTVMTRKKLSATIREGVSLIRILRAMADKEPEPVFTIHLPTLIL